MWGDYDLTRGIDGAARDRFTAEARAARRVAPFCVARILDAGLEGSHAYLVTEFVAGPLLSSLRAIKASQVPKTVTTAQTATASAAPVNTSTA